MRERVEAAPANVQQRLVLAAVLMRVVDGWCTATIDELAATCAMPRRTFQRHLAALIPKHLERVQQRPAPSALKPSQRAIAVAHSTRQREAHSTRHSGGTLPRAGADLRVGAKNSNTANRVRNAAELDRLLRGTNVLPFSKKNAPPDRDPRIPRTEGRTT